MNFKNLKTTTLALIAFAVLAGLAALNLPEGAPRFVAAGLFVAAGIWAYVKSHRDSGEPLI